MGERVHFALSSVFFGSFFFLDHTSGRFHEEKKSCICPFFFSPHLPSSNSFWVSVPFLHGRGNSTEGGGRDGAWGANLPFPSIPLCGKGSRNNSNNKEEKGRQEEEEEEAGPPVMTP